MKKIFGCLIGVMLMGLNLACNNKEDKPKDKPYKPIVINTKSAMLVQNTNKFGLDILKKVLLEIENDQNIMISPLSIYQALGMLWNGADGETKEQMSKVLYFSAEDMIDLNKNQQEIREALLSSDNQIALSIANSIWYRNDFNVLPEFLTTNKTYYNAEIASLDFTKSQESAKTINNWVSKNTNGKIDKIIEKISPSDVMYLTNAIYFYGEWTNKFKKDNTQKKTFTKNTGDEISVEMMNQTDNFRYMKNDLLTMVELPYGNTHFNMMVLLPNENKSVDEVLNELSDEQWKLWLSDLNSQQVNLSLPKFKFKSDLDLNNSLKALGMVDAFTGIADFSKINQQGGLAVSYVKHKSFIEVNEKGTEAAAVTNIGIFRTSLPQVYEFNANKPFLFAITEKDTQTILFLGKLMNPLN